MQSEEEKTIVDSSEIRKLEKVLSEVEKKEQYLIDEFDYNARSILGSELFDELIRNPEIVARLERIVSENRDGTKDVFYTGLLSNVHKSMIKNPKTRKEFEDRISLWFSKKSQKLRSVLDHKTTYDEIKDYVPYSFALASLAITTFHENPRMRLRDVQKLASIAMINGDVAELGTGEGKTLAGLLPTFFHALRGKGAHIITANSYLSKRDYDELRPILEGLGLSVGYLPESDEDLARIEGVNYDSLSYDERLKLNKRLTAIKQDAYSKDVTYGSKASFAFDYLRDSIAREKEDLLQREENPGFALIDEIDDVLIDDAFCPYVLGGDTLVYKENMTTYDLANLLKIPYSEFKSKLEASSIYLDRFQRISYEQARDITADIYDEILIPDQYTYQKNAQAFLESRILPYIYEVKEDNEFGIPAEELYENLTRNEKDYIFSKREKEIRNSSFVIYYPNKGKFFVSDECYDEFLTYCYLSFQIGSVVKKHQEEILEDSAYVKGKDYVIVGNNVVMMITGARKLISDKNHPDFIQQYERYMNMITPVSNEILHCFEQAINANLLLHRNRDYILDGGAIKVLKNGRVQDGSVFTDGIHQALEQKEHISRERMTSENQIVASITQKDFYNRYDTFSGMTGTSSKEVFREVYGKDTASIPRSAFYDYYSEHVKRKKRNSKVKPNGVEKRDTKFALDENDKIKLIINSIKRSRAVSFPQPVLLVASNPEELETLSKALSDAGITHSLLSAGIDKSKEAEIIARAGLPGAVTITTEMAGRGTDIKLGGDRDRLIEIATERSIRKIEESTKKPLNLSTFEREEFKKAVEKQLMESVGPTGRRLLWGAKEEKNYREGLAKLGLKVISSGYFKVDRIDRQLEGRTGRNNFGGICERYACPSDLHYIGVNSIADKPVEEYFSTFEHNSNGSLDLSSKDLKKIERRIASIQKSNESAISNNIIAVQSLSNIATNITEKCRDNRRKILFGRVDLDVELHSMLEDTVDNLLISYVTDGLTSKDSLTRDLARGKIDFDIKTFALEAKEVLGINIDVDSVVENGANILEFRGALISYVKSQCENMKKTNPALYNEKVKTALLNANDNLIASVPEILTNTTTQKSLGLISGGLGMDADAYANISFDREYQSAKLEASKNAVKSILGKPLSKGEKKILDWQKEKMFGLDVKYDRKEKEYDVSVPRLIENDSKKVEIFRKLTKPIERKVEKELKKADKKARTELQKGKKASSKLYSNLSVRFSKFVETLDGDLKFTLVKIKPELEKKDTDAKKK